MEFSSEISECIKALYFVSSKSRKFNMLISKLTFEMANSLLDELEKDEKDAKTAEVETVIMERINSIKNE